MSKKNTSSKKALKTSGSIASNTQGLTLLGKTATAASEVPSVAILESFPNTSPKRPYEICFTTSEFTSMCPVTGQPDYATITIHYVPKQRCIESKSLKLYLRAFRNQGVFAEGIVNRILDDLVAAIKPQSATVIGDFTPRGGIGLSVTASHPTTKRKK